MLCKQGLWGAVWCLRQVQVLGKPTYMAWLCLASLVLCLVQHVVKLWHFVCARSVFGCWTLCVLV
jgi:hypothetical protein